MHRFCSHMVCYNYNSYEVQDGKECIRSSDNYAMLWSWYLYSISDLIAFLTIWTKYYTVLYICCLEYMLMPMVTRYMHVQYICIIIYIHTPDYFRNEDPIAIFNAQYLNVWCTTMQQFTLRNKKNKNHGERTQFGMRWQWSDIRYIVEDKGP